MVRSLNGIIVSGSSTFVSFGALNDNTIEGLTSLLSVSKVQQESKLDGISQCVQVKVKIVYCCVRRICMETI